MGFKCKSSHVEVGRKGRLQRGGLWNRVWPVERSHNRLRADLGRRGLPIAPSICIALNSSLFVE